MKLRLIILAFGNFAVGTGSLIIAGILPVVAAELNVSITATGQLVTIYALTYALAAPLLAAFTSKIPRRTLLLTALLIMTVGTALAALAPTFELLFLARIMAALGGAMFTPTSSAVAVTLAPPAERGRALALVFAGLPVSTVLGVPLGTFIGNNFGWRAAFGLVAILGVLAIVAVALTIRSLAATPASSLRAWGALFREKNLMVALSVTFWQYTAQFMSFTYIAPLLKSNTGLDGTGVSIMLFVFGLAGVIGNSIGGRAADRLNLARALSFILLGLSVCYFLLPLLSLNWLAVAVLLFVWGLVGFSFNPIQQSRLLAIAPQTPGLVLSLNSSMLYFGNAAGAALGGIVVSNLSLPAVGWVGGVIGLIAFAALVISLRLHSHRAPAPVSA